MSDGYLISVGVKADFSELKQESQQAAEAVQEMSSEITEAFSGTSDAADTSGEALTALADAYAQIEAQGLQAVETMNALADAAALQAAATQDAAAAVAQAVEQASATSETAATTSAAVAAANQQVSAAYAKMAQTALEAANSQNRVSSVLQQYRSGALSAAVATQLLSVEMRENAAATAMLAASKAEAIAAEEELAAAQYAETDAGRAAAAAEEAEANAALWDATAVEAMGAAHGAAVPQVAAASAAIREFEGSLPIRAVERFLSQTLGLGPILQAAFPVLGAIAFGEVILQTAGKLHSVYKELLGIKTLREDIEKGNERDAQRGGQAYSQAIQTQHEVSMKANPLGTLSNDIFDQGKVVQALETAITNAQTAADGLREAAKTANPVFGQSAEKDTMAAAGQEAHKAALQAELEQQQAILSRMQQQFSEEKDKEAKAAETAEEKKQRAADATARKQEEALKKYEEGRERQAKADAEASAGLSKFSEESQKDTEKELDEMLVASQKELQAELKQSNALLEEQAKKTREAMAAQVDQNQRKQTDVKSQVQTRQISPQTEATELEALVQQKLGIQNAYYQALEALYNKDSVEWQKVEDERFAALRKDAQEMQVIQDNLANQTSNSLTKAFDQIGKQWMSVQDRMLKGQLSIGRGMQQMSSSMLLDAVHGYEKMIAQMIRMDLTKLASTTSTNAATVASNASAAAASTAVSRTNALEEVFIHAKVAAAKAFDWASGWGGPIAGAIAAAAAFTGVMAVGAFEQGGIIPGSIGSAVPIIGHAGEAVLPQPMTKLLMDVANSGGARGSTIHNGGNTFNGIADAKTFQKMLTKHERTVAQSTKRAIRNGRF